jgi:hypothetical protein
MTNQMFGFILSDFIHLRESANFLSYAVYINRSISQELIYFIKLPPQFFPGILLYIYLFISEKTK